VPHCDAESVGADRRVRASPVTATDRLMTGDGRERSASTVRAAMARHHCVDQNPDSEL
jgi:hypothetical protein